MLRTIREIQPRWIVGENVSGLINWDGGLVFEQVQADLEAEGYEVTPFILPAASVNAPHRRDRIWFIAHSDLFRCNRSNIQHEINTGERRIDALSNIEQSFNNGIDSDTKSKQSERFRSKQRETGQQEQGQPGRNGGRMVDIWNAPDTSNERLQGSQDIGGIGGIRTESNEQPSRFFRTDWEDFPTQSPICNGDDGIPTELDSISFSKWRTESVKAGGNAIVPQVAFQIFKAIQKYEELNQPDIQLFQTQI